MHADADKEDEKIDITRTVDARGPGYMTIAGAAVWIATRGMQIDVDPEDVIAMTAALQQIIDHAASGEMTVMGSIPDGLVPERVPAKLFISCPIAYLPGIVAETNASGDRIVLRSWAFESDNDWENGFDDSLARGGETYWEKLRVNRSDVLKLWPFPAEDLGPVAPDMTGAPGRPTKSMNLIGAEFERRFKSGQAFENRTEEAEYLLAWLANAYPGKPPPTKKTVTNHISVRRREDLKA